VVTGADRTERPDISLRAVSAVSNVARTREFAKTALVDVDRCVARSPVPGSEPPVCGGTASFARDSSRARCTP